MGYKFTTKAQTIQDLPTDTEQFVRDAEALVAGITSDWKKTKTYNYKLSTGEKQPVMTFSNTINGEHWMARSSVLDGSKHNWDKIVQYSLGAEKSKDGWVVEKHKHTEYEIEYTHVLSKWGKYPLESFPGYSGLADHAHLEKWASIWAEYELGAPLTTREFHEFILVVEPGYVNDCAYVIQLVADHESNPAHVQGVYTSIERFKPLAGGEIEWTMTTASDSGGNVPKWLQNSMIAKSVSADVPAFLDWLAAQ